MKGQKRMKKFILILAFLAVFSFQGIGLAIDVKVETGFQLDWWKDSEHNSGSQTSIPLKISAEMTKEFSVSLLTGYAYTYYAPNVDKADSTSNGLDTKLNFSYLIPDKLPFLVLLGLDFNLPGSKRKLTSYQIIQALDPDLVSITKFGEGFNINPTLTIAKEWGNWTAGLGIGYLWSGEYDYATDLKNYDPGNVFNVTAEVRYAFSPAWSARLFGQYASYGKDTVEGHDSYQEGDFYLTGVGLGYSQKTWDAAFTVQYIFRNKSEFPTQAGELVNPGHGINGNQTNVDLLVRYLVSDRTTLWTKLSGLLLEANDFPSDSSFYVGQREKISLEIGGKRMFGKNAEASLFLRGFNMHDDPRHYPDVRDGRSFYGLSVGGSLTAQF
jgi:hypothetical protein